MKRVSLKMKRPMNVMKPNLFDAKKVRRPEVPEVWGGPVKSKNSSGIKMSVPTMRDMPPDLYSPFQAGSTA
jgi:hypothetical protein